MAVAEQSLYDGLGTPIHQKCSEYKLFQREEKGNLQHDW